MPNIWNLSSSWTEEVNKSANGFLPTADDSSFGSKDTFLGYSNLLKKHIAAGTLFPNPTVTFLNRSPYTANFRNQVLAPDGSIHFIPENSSTTYGLRLNKNNTFNTYSLISPGTYTSGVLTPDGCIHFIPQLTGNGTVGQKVDTRTLTVTTYSLINNTWTGSGILSPNGYIYHLPYYTSNNIGTKIDYRNNSVTTFSFVVDVSQGSLGSTLGPDGHIYVTPTTADYMLKINPFTDEVTTISLNGLFPFGFSGLGGHLTPDGRIIYVSTQTNNDGVSYIYDPSNNIWSTYQAIYVGSAPGNNYRYWGGVISSNGDLHFIPYATNIGQKVNLSTFQASTYSLSTTSLCYSKSGILDSKGYINFLLGDGTSRILKVYPYSGLDFDINVAISPYFNKS